MQLEQIDFACYILSYKTFKSAITLVLIRNQVLAKKYEIYNTAHKMLEKFGNFINLSSRPDQIID